MYRPGSGGRVFKLVSKKQGEVFRFDVDLLKKYNGYYIYPHYHVKPNLNDHHSLISGDGTIYWGKDKPPGF
ncbi:YpjP family protein [Desulfotomaculum defluvii]